MSEASKATEGLRGPLRAAVSLAVILACFFLVRPCSAFYNNDRWQVTATDFLTGPIGTPITLTWGIADDGSNIPDVFPGDDRPSDFIAAFDGFYGSGPGGDDLTQRPWFGYVESSFERWDELSGVNFVYEPADDGAEHGSSTGIIGRRADLRLGGTLIDGTVGGNKGTVGYSIAPDNADVVLDTGDAGYYGDPAGDAFGLRHTLMHEVGHSLGLGHVTSPNSGILMEAFIQTGFDGPQLDDIRGVHFLYGDYFENSGGNYGNETLANSTPLGMIAVGEILTLGADGDTGTTIALEQTDFVSLSNSSDIDFFEFSIASDAIVDLTATPVGASYVQRIGGGPFETIDASEIGDLTLDLYRVSNSQLLDSVDAGGVGDAESLPGIELAAGEYAVRISGVTSETQLYQLDIAVAAPPVLGDYNGNGTVDAPDYTVWRDTLGSISDLRADGDQSGEVDSNDYFTWLVEYYASGLAASTPEPSSLGLIACGALISYARRRTPLR